VYRQDLCFLKKASGFFESDSTGSYNAALTGAKCFGTTQRFGNVGKLCTPLEDG